MLANYRTDFGRKIAGTETEFLRLSYRSTLVRRVEFSRPLWQHCSHWRATKEATATGRYLQYLKRRHELRQSQEEEPCCRSFGSHTSAAVQDPAGDTRKPISLRDHQVSQQPSTNNSLTMSLSFLLRLHLFWRMLLLGRLTASFDQSSVGTGYRLRNFLWLPSSHWWGHLKKLGAEAKRGGQEGCPFNLKMLLANSSKWERTATHRPKTKM